MKAASPEAPEDNGHPQPIVNEYDKTLLCIVGKISRPFSGKPKISLEFNEIAAYSPYTKKRIIS